MAYKVIISDEVTQAIDSIHDYITTVFYHLSLLKILWVKF